jgi:hypothetical protein
VQDILVTLPLESFQTSVQNLTYFFCWFIFLPALILDMVLKGFNKKGF